MFKKIALFSLILVSVDLCSARRIPARGEEPAEQPLVPIPVLLPGQQPPAPAPAPVIPALLPVPQAPAEIPAGPGEAKEQKEKESKERETKEREEKEEETQTAAIPDALIVHVPAQYKIPGIGAESINTNEDAPGAGGMSYKDIISVDNEAHQPTIIARAVIAGSSRDTSMVKYYSAPEFMHSFKSSRRTPERAVPIQVVTFYIYDPRNPEKGLQFLITEFQLLPSFQDIFLTTNSIKQATAQVNLARAFWMNRNYDFAFLFVKAAAKQNDNLAAKALAQERLGDMYFNGLSVPKNYKKALMYLEPASKQSASPNAQAFAQVTLGQIYFLGGDGVSPDYAKARTYLESLLKQSANPNSQAIAQVTLGQIYVLGGDGVSRDYAKARTYLEPASEQTANPEAQAIAQEKLGQIYFLGGDGVSRDYAKALTYLEPLLKQSANPSAQTKAQVALGQIYLLGGNGVSPDYAPDYAKALTYLELVLKQSANPEAQAIAQARLGEMYYFGLGVPRDYTTALANFSAVAAKDVAQGIKNTALGFRARMLFYGHGTKKNVKEAINILQQMRSNPKTGLAEKAAAELWLAIIDYEQTKNPTALAAFITLSQQTNNPEASATAHYFVGLLSRNTENNDPHRAYSALTKAAQTLLDPVFKAKAEYQLGEMYRLGTPATPKNYQTAVEHYKLADNQYADNSDRINAQFQLAKLFAAGSPHLSQNIDTARIYFEMVKNQQSNVLLKQQATEMLKNLTPPALEPERKESESKEERKQESALSMGLGEGRRESDSKEEAATPEARGTKRKPDDQDPNTRGTKRPEPGQS